MTTVTPVRWRGGYYIDRECIFSFDDADGCKEPFWPRQTQIAAAIKEMLAAKHEPLFAGSPENCELPDGWRSTPPRPAAGT